MRYVSHPSRRNTLRATCVCGLLLLVAMPTTANAWGDHGHQIIGLAAAQALPNDMPAFFRNAAAQLAYLNPEPDRWKERAERALDPALIDGTSPAHYVNLDATALPVMRAMLRAPNRFAFADSLRRRGLTLSSTGVLPYEILELSQRLRSNFRLWRIAPDATVRRWIEQRIIDDAGILGHYVADGSNPAHTSKHHNGWVGTNPKRYTTDRRFHYRFETEFVQAHIRTADVSSAITTSPVVFRNLRTAVVDYLAQSHSELEPLYVLDTRTPFREQRATPEQRAFATARLAAGATMLRDIWYTAWVTSAK